MADPGSDQGHTCAPHLLASTALLDGRRPRERLLLRICREHLHEWIWFELGNVLPTALPRPGRPLRRGGLEQLRRLPSLLLSLGEGVPQHARGLRLVALGEVVRKPAILPRHLHGVAVEHHAPTFHPDRAG